MPATFLGVLDIPLRTFTNSYSPYSGGGWSWSPGALMPIEFASNRPSATVGIGVSLFDYATGNTKYTYGDLSSITGAANPNNVIFKRRAASAGTICGWLVGPSALVPFEFNDNIILGTPKTTSFTPATSLQLPNVSNTTFPEPFVGSNYETADGMNAAGYRVNLSPFAAFLNPYSAGVNFGNAITMPLGTNAEVQFVIPYNGMNYIFMRDTTGGLPTAFIYVSPNFISLASQFTPTLTNPPGSSIDLNAYITAVSTSNPTGTYKGYLWINRNALNITGRTLNGFGILMAPDGSAYYLINFVPVDAGAANWQAGVSDIIGKFDDTGVLWMKLASSPNIIFSTLPLSKAVVPAFPPIGLPSPPNDSQITVRAMRGQSQ